MPSERTGVAWKMFKTIPRGIGVDTQSTRSPLEAMGWVSKWETTASFASANRCGELWVLGGFAKFGPGARASRTFSTPGQHKSLLLRLAVLFIDSWDLDDAFVVEIDGRQVWTMRPNLMRKALPSVTSFEVEEHAEAYEAASYAGHLCGAGHGGLLGAGQGKDPGLVIANIVVGNHTGERATVRLRASGSISAFDESWALAGAEVEIVE